MVKIEVSIGELIDKITILEIKQEEINDESKLGNIKKELDILRKSEIDVPEKIELKDVNQQLWKLEEKIRTLEAGNLIDRCSCSVSIHMLNDERAKIKRTININTKSNIIEEKSHFMNVHT